MGTHTEELFTSSNSEVLENALVNHTPIFYKKVAGTKKILYAHCIHCCETVLPKEEVEADVCRNWYIKHVVSDCSKVWFKYEDEFKKYQQRAVLIEKDMPNTEELNKTIKGLCKTIEDQKEEIGYLKDDLSDRNKDYDRVKEERDKIQSMYYDEQDKHKKTINAILDAYQVYMKCASQERYDELWEELNELAQGVYFKDIEEDEDE
jgi:predicted RNase H-like nuclease (RuvC/YqgF family)